MNTETQTLQERAAQALAEEMRLEQAQKDQAVEDHRLNFQRELRRIAGYDGEIASKNVVIDGFQFAYGPSSIDSITWDPGDATERLWARLKGYRSLFFPVDSLADLARIKMDTEQEACGPVVSPVG